MALADAVAESASAPGVRASSLDSAPATALDGTVGATSYQATALPSAATGMAATRPLRALRIGKRFATRRDSSDARTAWVSAAAICLASPNRSSGLDESAF